MAIVPDSAPLVPTDDPFTDAPSLSFPFESDDFPGFSDDPPSEDDRRWWAESAPRVDPPVEDYSDFAAWLDCWHHLEWSYYPGEGNWSDRNPCLPV